MGAAQQTRVMPNRMLRDYSDSLRFEYISAEAERQFIRLIQKADDFGRFHADPRLVRAACFPLLPTISEADISRWLSDLEKAGLIVLYKGNGRNYLAIIDFRQRTRQMASKFPSPDGEAKEWRPMRDGQSIGRLSAADGQSVGGLDGDGDGDGDVGRTASGPPPSAADEPLPASKHLKGKKKQQASDEEYIAELAVDPAYDGIDVRREAAKMLRWCSANGKQASRRRLVNWLNRADKPLVLSSGNGHGSQAKSDPTPQEIAAWIDTRPDYTPKRDEWTRSRWDQLPQFARLEFNKWRYNPAPQPA
jgi:hypothetical protein